VVCSLVRNCRQPCSFKLYRPKKSPVHRR
jgi:hypothetical protein